MWRVRVREARVSGMQRSAARERAGLLECVGRGAVLRELGATFTGGGLRRGGWPGSSCRAPHRPPSPQPRPGTSLPRSLPAGHMLTPSWSHTLFFHERAVWWGLRRLSPAFLWAPDRQEPWSLPPPCSDPTSPSPMLGAEKSSPFSGGKGKGARERQGSGVDTDQWGPRSPSASLHTVLWTGESSRSPISPAGPGEDEN